MELSGKKRPDMINQLVEICEISGDFKRCVNWLETLSDTKSSGNEKADIWVKIGDIQKEKLDDEQGALRSYQRASDFDPANIRAATSLKSVFAGRGDHGAALQMLRREIEATDGNIAKSKLYAEIGRIYRLHLEEIDKAIEHYEKAFSLDPTSVEAGEPLAELYREQGNWDEAIKIFDHFSESASAMSKDKSLELFLRYGEAALERKDFDKARKAFAKAREIDPRDGYTLEKLAGTVFEMKDWKAAAAAYNDFLLRFSDTLDKDRKIAIHMKLATSYRELDELPRALLFPGPRQLVAARAQDCGDELPQSF